MRVKLFATLFSALALAGLGIGSASASASTLTIYNSLEEAAQNASFLNAGQVQVNSSGGSWQCQEFRLSANITKNEADPVTLQLINAKLDSCESSSGHKWVYSGIKATAPITLNADGTGALPIQLNEYRKDIGTCVRSGTLNLTWDSAGNVDFEGVLKGTGGSCPYATTVWSGNFAPPTDLEGEPLGEWVVTP